MRLTPQGGGRADTDTACTLIVADWTADPQALVSVCAEHAGSARLALLVPPILHGVDWIGDPYANVPCARRALVDMSSHLQAANLPVQTAELGDHDSVAAVMDVVLKQRVDRIVVCEPSRRVRPRQLDLAHRARWATGLPVIHVAVAPAEPRRRRLRWFRLWRGECAAARPASTLTGAVSA